MTLMRIRPPAADGKAAADKSESPRAATRGPLLTVRTALVLSGGLLIGLTAGVLTYFANHNLALAALAFGPACAGAIMFLDAIIA
jgi:hypothetical protein